MKLWLKEVFLMNKKGQSLIVFVLILPIIIFFIAFFINSMIMFMENNRLNGIIKDNMEIILNKNIRDSIIIKNTEFLVYIA